MLSTAKSLLPDLVPYFLIEQSFSEQSNVKTR